MGALDEDLLNKITYSPECQATFKKYKKILFIKIIIAIGITSFASILVVTFIYINVIIGDAEDKGQYIVFLFVALFMVVLLLKMVHLLYLTIKDLFAKKLNITTDTIVAINHSDGRITFAKSNAPFKISMFLDKEIKENTSVYIIRTIHTNTLLDIIPIENINIAP